MSDKRCDDKMCHGDEESWRACVTKKFDQGHQRMSTMEAQIKINTEAISAVKSDTTELVEILNAVKGGLKVLSVLGIVIKYVAGIAAAATALWHAFGDKLKG